MIDQEKLEYVIDLLVKEEKFKEAREVLDIFVKYAKTISDFDALGACAMKAQYLELRLRCSIFGYVNSITSEQLFLARENLYTCYNSMNYPEKALFYIELNLKVKPNDPETLLAKACNLSLMGKRTEAEDIISNVQVMSEDEKLIERTQHTLSGKYLREGNIKQGVYGFLGACKPKNPLFEDQLKLKFWDGIIQPGKTIVVNGEGGIGDELINIRFFDRIKELGMRPVLYSSWYKCRPDITDLFRRHGYEVITNTIFLKSDYLWTHMMSLPSYLGLNESQLWTGPYLKPLRQEKNKLDDKKFKIGIKCNGNPYFEQDIYRTVPIDQLMGIMPEDVSIYYFDLDKEYDGTISLKGKIKNWEDTLDYIDQMDVIVSSCTSLVHAAGAMGKRTIVMVPIAKYYVWTSTRTDESTPWYGDNLKVIEQTVVRSWKEPLERVGQLLLEYKES